VLNRRESTHPKSEGCTAQPARDKKQRTRSEKEEAEERKGETYLDTGVEVEPNAVSVEGGVSANVAVRLVLLDDVGHRECEEDRPGNADFGKHLDINASDPRVKRRAHEVVVDDVAVHAVPVTDDVAHGGESKSGDARDGKEGAIEVDSFREGETADVEVVCGTDKGDGRVDGGVGVAVVVESLVAEVGEGKTFLHHARHDEGEEELSEDEGEVDGSSTLGGSSVLFTAM
jgi:hypothetical protein